jgi:RNA polymerase sigma-70 factor, ECF subfamily
MRNPSPNEITQLLLRWGQCGRTALDQLMPVVYEELHKMAHSFLRRERPDHTLQPTALINEAYLRLVKQDFPEWRSRRHFYGVAAQLMRQILVDHARTRAANKRGGAEQKFSLDEALTFSDEKAAALVALDDALAALGKFDQRKVCIIDLRFFGGFSLEETAAALGLSVPMIGHEIRLARAWLRREMNSRNHVS